MSFWIYGLHAVQAALLNPHRQCIQLAKLPQVNCEIKQPSVDVITVDKNFFNQKFGSQAVHQGVALKVEPLNHHKNILNFIHERANANDNSLIVILDQITDPHNVGAIIRAAVTMNVAAIIVSHHQSVNLTSAILYKTASGAMEHIPVFEVINLNQTIQLMKENKFWIMGLDESGKSTLNSLDLKGHYGLILGAEGKGMRRLVQESCDYLVRLPTSSHFSTLNVSHAGAIAFYAFHLQHLEN